MGRLWYSAFVILRDPEVKLSPEETALWNAILEISREFNGYDHFGGLEACAAVARRVGGLTDDGRLDSVTDDELRGSLFFAARAAHHHGYPPEGAALQRLGRQLAQLRQRDPGGTPSRHGGV